MKMDIPAASDTSAMPANQPVLEVRDLCVEFPTSAGVVRAVDGVSFTVGAGETLGIVGESGSGKSITALAAMRLLDEPGRIVRGEVRFCSRDVRALSATELQAMRGGDLAMIFQNPMTTLNPVQSIGKQLAEAMIVHGKSKGDAVTRSVSLLGRMGIATPARAVRSFPHQFSGGMRQRVVVAMGMSNEPALLLADEPTTALDVTIQAQILDLLRDLNRNDGTALVLISHDLGVVAGICDRLVVMYAGEIVEQGPTSELLAEPRHPYTRALINAVPRLDEKHVRGRRLTAIEGLPPDPLLLPKGCRFAPRCPLRRQICDAHPPMIEIAAGRLSRCWVAAQGERFETAVRVAEHPVKHVPSSSVAPLVEVRGLVKYFPVPSRLLERANVTRAVDNIDFVIARGETLGVVGESGCGKSTLGRLLVRIHHPDRGEILFDGKDIARLSASAIRPLRREMQMVFQDPYTSLNPRMTVEQLLAEMLRYHNVTAGKTGTRERISELLGLVGLSPKMMGRYPHEFSGGQRQRISIARALTTSPRFIVADEPISALDVNIQAQIVNLMIELQERLHLTYLFIAHDLAVVRHISERIMVLHLGQIAEIAPSVSLFAEPLHPYTRYLISAIPVPDVALERSRQRLILPGEPATAVDPPSGCRFRTRCPIARPICAEISPPLEEKRPRHFVACHFPGQF